MNKAITVSNFVSKDDADYLINAVNELNSWESGGSEFWDNRITNYFNICNYNKKAADIMFTANTLCKQVIMENYKLDRPVYSDTLQVVRWFPGLEQHPHADDMTNTDVEGFDHRVFGSIIYLNSNYKGGHTFYPNFNFEIVPEQGKLAVHPGDPEHLHGVTKIEENIRYTIASFWTYEKDKSHDWSIYK